MGKFLTTAGVASAIEDIIRKSSTYFVIITPYLKLSKLVELRLKDANKRKVQMTFIYGKTELSYDELEKLQKLEHLELFYCDNLHAKCYHNEQSMVLSSMNLHEYSEKNNLEMGVLFDRIDDKDIFDDVLYEIECIKNASTQVKPKLFAPGIVQPYVNLTDFHLPLLLKMLQSRFPDVDFLLEGDTIKADLPNANRLHIDIRVILRFGSIKELKVFKEKIQQYSDFKERCFWNEKTLHYYLPKGYQTELTENEQLFISGYHMNFIEKAIAYL